MNLELFLVDEKVWWACIPLLNLKAKGGTKREAFVALGSTMKRIKKKDLEALK